MPPTAPPPEQPQPQPPQQQQSLEFPRGWTGFARIRPTASLEEIAAHRILEVPRRDRLPLKEFIREYEIPRIPVILTGIDLPKWTPDMFAERFPHRLVPLNVGSEIEEDVAMKDYVEFLLKRRTELPSDGSSSATACGWEPRTKGPYLRNLQVAEWFPELWEEVVPLWCFFQPNWINTKWDLIPYSLPDTWYNWAELFIGGPDSLLPFIHYDNFGTQGFAAQLYGEKTYLFWPPHMTRRMYPGKAGVFNISQVPPDFYEDKTRCEREFPEFPFGEAVQATVRAGEILWVPSGWWHVTLRQTTVNISVGGNYINAKNWLDFEDEAADYEEQYLAEWRARNPSDEQEDEADEVEDDAEVAGTVG